MKTLTGAIFISVFCLSLTIVYITKFLIGLKQGYLNDPFRSKGILSNRGYKLLMTAYFIIIIVLIVASIFFIIGLIHYIKIY